MLHIIRIRNYESEGKVSMYFALSWCGLHGERAVFALTYPEAVSSSSVDLTCRPLRQPI